MENLGDVFQEAVRLFQASLPDEVKSQLQEYATVEAMNVSIRKQIEEITDELQKSRLYKCFNKFRDLGLLMNPYFQIVDIFVQTNPRYLGLFWGSLRLIFQLSSNYVEYLEKLSTMFDNFARALPSYEDMLEKFASTIVAQGKGFPPRLAQSMVDIYVDVMRFCYRALSLFSAKSKVGLRFKTSLIGRLAWKPFDREFDDIMTRFETHRKLFEFEAEFAMHHEALNFYKKYDEDMERLKNGDELSSREGEETFKEHEESLMKHLLKSRVEDIGLWIHPPQWKDRYEEMSHLKAEGTGGWIVHESAYVSWRAKEHPILWIQGKPGFGKSTLCPVVIDDLSSFETNAPVCYFFFDKQRGQDQGDLAFRALLVQLLDRYRDDSKAVDIVSAIFDRKTLGQSHATQDEVLAVLRLLLAQFPGAVFVLDATDECNETEEFPERLHTTTENCSTCSLCVFTRPTILLLDEMQDRTCFIRLDHSHNSLDMRLFLRPRLETWVRRGMLPTLSNMDACVDGIIHRSNGIFLWIKLLTVFLGSRMLTKAQRVDALDNLNRLQGLDKLFDQIERKIKTGLSELDQDTIRRAFRWVLGASRPLVVEELQVAVVIPLDRAITDMDIIPDFQAAITSFSGGLLEVTMHRTVQFIHISAHEFFTTVGSSGPGDCNGFSLYSTEAEIHQTIVTGALSYLLNTIPSAPLSGDPQLTAASHDVARKYPLLKYTAGSWSHHAVFTFQSVDKGHLGTEDVTPFHALLARFLGSKDAVLTWLEACWTLELEPDICEPPACIIPEIQDKPIQDYMQLRRDVMALIKDWAYLLAKEPNEVWGASVAAFTLSPFWSQGAHSHVTCLSSPYLDTSTSIHLVSQTSSNGAMLGSMSLIPPSNMLQNTSMDTSGWQAQYDIWTVSNCEHKTSLSWIIDPDSLKLLLQYTTQGQCKSAVKFPFPLSISDDLQDLIAVNLVIRIDLDNQEHSVAQSCSPVRYYILDVFGRVPPCPRTLRDDTLQLKIWPTQTGTIIVTFRRAGGIFTSESGIRSHECHLQFFFTPDSESLKPFLFASWTVDVPAISSKNYCQQGLKFHPHKALVAFHVFTPFAKYPPVNARTCLWNFENSLRHAQLHQGPPRLHCAWEGVIGHMEFSSDGQFLYGEDVQSSRPVIVNVEECLRPQHRQLTPGVDPGLKNQQLIPNCNPQYLLPLAAATPIQHSDLLRFTHASNGTAQISHLSQLEGQGSIVLRTLSSDGTLREQTLSRLPDRLKAISVPTVLHPESGHGETGNVKIVLNKTPQERYTFADVGDTSLPAIVERSWESVPTVTTVVGTGMEGGRLLEDGMKMLSIN
ncbi:hypothetical protein BJX99DRAFT_261719 [Aspergillus californicus]